MSLIGHVTKKLPGTIEHKPKQLHIAIKSFFYILNRMFTLWSLIEATMLCLNAVCVLHEERFLAKGNSMRLSDLKVNLFLNNSNCFLIGCYTFLLIF